MSSINNIVTQKKGGLSEHRTPLGKLFHNGHSHLIKGQQHHCLSLLRGSSQSGHALLLLLPQCCCFQSGLWGCWGDLLQQPRCSCGVLCTLCTTQVLFWYNGSSWCPGIPWMCSLAIHRNMKRILVSLEWYFPIGTWGSWMSLIESQRGL